MAPCGRDDDPSEHDRPRGQAIVEFALVAPVLLLMLLGFIEVGRLFYIMATYHDATVVLADAVASNGIAYPSSEFDALAASEEARVGCDVRALTVTDDGFRVVATLRCAYHPIAYAGLAVDVTAEGAR